MLLRVVFSLMILVNVSDTSAQTGANYVYDERGRLIAVIDPTGETAVYTYDTVGNLLSISRRSSSAISIISFSPKEGPVGTEVTIYGTGFSAIPTQNTVRFNGTSATLISATANKLIVTVRTGTATGAITVTSPAGTATSLTPFTIAAGIKVNPAVSGVLPSSVIQFTATVISLLGDQSVTWSVDGIAGGNAEVGTISATGYYTISPQPSVHLIRATSVAVPTLFGEAQVAAVNPESVRSLLAPPVAVSRGISTGATITSSNLVAVRRGLAGGYLPMSAPVAVRYGSATGTGRGQSQFISVIKGPNITTVAPGNLTRGMSLTLTVSGANLTGATALNFINSAGQIETNIVASNIAVSGGGTTLTATVTTTSGTAPGRCVIVITTPNGGTTTNDIGVNTINVVP